MRNNITVIVATHKEYKMPNDDMYVPVYVGAEISKQDLGYQKDNEGENISSKNKSYCELSGLYWLWKNVDTEYKGLVHYRRHFMYKKKDNDPFKNILSSEEIGNYFPRCKIIVPKKRKYYIETLYSHYSHTHYASHLDETRKVIIDLYPDYLDSFDTVLKRTYGFMFNMMIMKNDLFDTYCEWLFNILFELEKRIDNENSDLSTFQGRFYGRVSEIIFNVWLDKQLKDRNLDDSEVKEVPYIYMEKIDWFKKCTSFIKAKFCHKKYEGSF